MKISVALCTYNGEKYIEKQIESIICQTMVPNQIVICDDCSNDNTIKIIKKCMKKYKGDYRIIVNQENLGFKKNFYKAMSLCNGDVILLSDQDDLWRRDKIEKIEKIFRFDEKKEIALVFHDAIIVDKDLKVLKSSFWREINFHYEEFASRNYKRLRSGNVVQGAACAFRRELVSFCEPAPYEANHDEWIALCAIKYGLIVPINEKLLMYRQDNNVIGVGKMSLMDKLRIRLTSWSKSKKMHFRQLEERTRVISVFAKKINRIGIDENEWVNYHKFINWRIMKIRNRQVSIVFDFFKYIREYVSVKYAIKSYIKDVIASIF